MDSFDFSKYVRDKEIEYNKKQMFLKLAPIITFGYHYPDIDFELLVKINCRTDDGCVHYFYNENIFSQNYRTNTWTNEPVTPFFETYLKPLRKKI
jgi:hypothetical protein